MNCKDIRVKQKVRTSTYIPFSKIRIGALKMSNHCKKDGKSENIPGDHRPLKTGIPIGWLLLTRAYTAQYI